MTDFRFHVTTEMGQSSFEFLEPALLQAQQEAFDGHLVTLTVTWGNAEIILREWEDNNEG